MKKNIIKAVFAVLMVLPLTSCDDFLTKVNPNETTTDTYWQDLTQTQSGLYATYAVLRNDYLLNIREEAWRSDMAWPGYGRPTPQNNDAGWTWYCQMYNSTTSEVSKKWDALYTGVWRANQVIEALENNFDYETLSDSDKETWDYQMGQARFMRGLMYFYLSSAFNEGSVVLRTKVPASTEEYNQALAPAEDVLEFYRADLLAAYELLPNVSPTGTTYVGLPTKGTAATILGTSYLYKHDYAEAEKYFDDVIHNSEYGYKLETDLSKMFTNAGEFNSESIFEITFSTDKRQDIDTWNSNCMYNRLDAMTTSTVGCLLPAWVAWDYMNEPMDPNVATNYIDGDMSKGLRHVSLRASAMVGVAIDFETPFHITGNVSEQANYFGGPNGEWGFGKYKKYYNADLAEAGQLISGKNVTVNRLSDVYLMYAECLLERGEVQEAIDYINEIRYRWGLVLIGKSGKYGSRTYDNLDYSAEDVLYHLQYVERPMELSFEGHQIRWQDMLRWGMLEDDNNNRFKDVSTSPAYEFWSDNIETYKLDGTYNKSLTNAYLSIDEPVDNTSAKFIDYEYDQAAQNYTKSKNAYLPIPENERMNNSAIN